MSALETSQRTDEPETSPSPADEQTQVGTGARSSLPREELLRVHRLHPMPGYPDRLQVLGNAAPESAGLGCHPGLCISNKFSSNVDVARLANLNKQSIFFFFNHFLCLSFSLFQQQKQRHVRLRSKTMGQNHFVHQCMYIWHLAQHLHHLGIQEITH